MAVQVCEVEGADLGMEVALHVVLLRDILGERGEAESFERLEWSVLCWPHLVGSHERVPALVILERISLASYLWDVLNLRLQKVWLAHRSLLNHWPRLELVHVLLSEQLPSRLKILRVDDVPRDPLLVVWAGEEDGVLEAERALL